MPSPFPGMDPYLESPRYWLGLHQALIVYLRDALQPELHPGYWASTTERLYIESAGRSIYPDAAVLTLPLPEVRETAFRLEPTHRELPLIFSAEDDAIREPFIEIRPTSGGEVVTVIELISPANKATYSDGRSGYLRKQMEVLNSPTHIVEVDLHREGEHAVAVPKAFMPDAEPFEYMATVVRKPKRLRYELYPFTLPERMPDLNIPLLPEDPDVKLPLQAAFDRAYDNGAYANVIDYTRQPEPPLTAEQWEWAQTLLAAPSEEALS